MVEEPVFPLVSVTLSRLTVYSVVFWVSLVFSGAAAPVRAGDDEALSSPPVLSPVAVPLSEKTAPLVQSRLPAPVLATPFQGQGLLSPSDSSAQSFPETVAGDPKEADARKPPWRRVSVRLLPGEEVVGSGQLQYKVRGPETLVVLARQYGMGFHELRIANPGLSTWVPTPGTVITGSFQRVLPQSLARIVINLPEMRLYHRHGDGLMDTYPVGIGRQGIATPLGKARVIGKAVAPTWTVPRSIRADDPTLPAVVPPGPDNPLGSHALYLSMPGYLLHGTNQPYGIGRRVSHGCIRLYPEDIVRFFGHVTVGQTVEIVHQPIKAGWRGEDLYLEIHAPLSDHDPVPLTAEATTVIRRALGRRPGLRRVLDWRLVDQMAARADGIARRISQHPANSPTESVGELAAVGAGDLETAGSTGQGRLTY